MFRSFSKRKYHLTYETVCLKLSLLLVKFFNTISNCVWYVFVSLCSLAETFKYFKTFRPFRQIMYNDFTHLSVLQIMYENYYYEQLVKIITFVKYSIDAFHGFMLRYTFCRCVSRNVNSRDYHGDSLNIVFLLVFRMFSTDFYGILGCFSCFPSVFLLFPILNFL